LRGDALIGLFALGGDLDPGRAEILRVTQVVTAAASCAEIGENGEDAAVVGVGWRGRPGEVVAVGAAN
jgi:hypothetical protein